MHINRVVRAGVVTGVVDGLFSSVLSALFYGSTVARLFRGVAATLLGARALEGGAGMVAIGVAMHFGVALAWSAVFMLLTARSTAVRRLIVSPSGIVTAAAIYGPFVWLVMSLLVIPALTARPPAITYRWFVQLIGHAPFVGLPIVSVIGGKQMETVSEDVRI